MDVHAAAQPVGRPARLCTHDIIVCSPIGFSRWSGGRTSRRTIQFRSIPVSDSCGVIEFFKYAVEDRSPGLKSDNMFVRSMNRLPPVSFLSFRDCSYATLGPRGGTEGGTERRGRRRRERTISAGRGRFRRSRLPNRSIYGLSSHPSRDIY